MIKKTSLLLLSGISPLFAQDFLDPLYVTATRSEKKESSSPYTSSYLDQNFLTENTRRTLPDAFQFTPGVLVQKTAPGHGSPFIRGFSGRQNLLLIDGVRFNNSTFRGGPVQYWNTVDSGAIEHIELIKSQGSVLYGSDAIGGTANVFTKSSRFRTEAEGKAYVGGSAAYEYRTNGEGSHTGRLETETGIGGKFGVLLGLTAKDFGDISDSSVGRMKNTGYTEQNLDFRFDWAVTPESTVTLGHYQVNQDDISRWHRTSDNPGWIHGPNVAAPGSWTADDYDQERSMTYLRYAGENSQQNAPIQRWSATLSYQTSQDSEFQNRTGEIKAPGAAPLPPTDTGALRYSNIDVETTGVDLLLESKIGPGTLVYGLDFYHDEVESSGSRSDAVGGPLVLDTDPASDNKARSFLPIADDSAYDLFGTYAQYEWTGIERLAITGGARYTYVDATLGRFTGGEDQSRNWDNLSGSLRGNYSLDGGWSVYGGLSQAFRAPNLDDLSGNLTAKSSNNALGSINVDPEKFITYEIGTRYTTEKASVNLAAFYTDVEDLITSSFTDNTLKTSIATNAGSGYVYGFELEGAWNFYPQWTLSGFAAWQDGETEAPTFLGGPEEKRSNARLLPLSGSVALRWTDASSKYWVEGRVLGAANEHRISDVDQQVDNQRTPTGGTPGYLVTSLRAGWRATENLDLTCAVENLTDEDYRNHASGQNEPGINGIFGVKVKW